MSYDVLLHKYQEENEQLKKELDDLEEQLFVWEDVPEEELFEDGELEVSEVLNKIKSRVFEIGDWKITRRKHND